MTITGDTCGTITIEYSTGVVDSLAAGDLVGKLRLRHDPERRGGGDSAQWTGAGHTISVYNNCAAPCATPPLDTTTLVVT